MKTPAKIGLGLIALIVAAVILFSVLVLQNLDSIVKRVIEQTGTTVVGTSVSLAEVKLTLKDGRGELHGLSIANPTGYEADNAFEMDQIALQINPASISGDVIVIDEILVDGALLNIEQAAGKSNLKQLLENIESQAGEAAPEPEPTESGAEILLAVGKFSFINSTAKLTAPGIETTSMDIPDIRVSNLGSAEQGLTPAQLAQRVTRQLLQQVEQAASAKVEQLAKDYAKKELEKQMDSNLSDKDKAKVDGFKSLLKK
ncbi:hypothetical protein EYC98_15040 [Halieaceae bacterium IMCC14734]|uniref:AsmA domain-containing protein n=1 Tax=Candidatus Litorirhabdus singularis TaxID=2518993 RepID=A0ABT3TK55_9GAMM|nr:hypothetical protein [Candidatus Litorirhabdus singularis]MCX2982175.1 hypothetical protein [Candidatus Litorirhabdus singularis]